MGLCGRMTYALIFATYVVSALLFAATVCAVWQRG